ncbi:MAG: molybdopterin-binding protein [Oscillospiraceae bacterium]|nr:molybdopterin-binding protein [Oscillospiraceae bacterium]
MYRTAIITVSDKASQGIREDMSGPAIAALLIEAGYEIAQEIIIPDDRAIIEQTLLHCADTLCIPLILTTGGTGFSPRDVTPEATVAVCDRLAPGIPEAMRAHSLTITPRAMLSRAAAGMCGQSLIVNLPGSPKAAAENLEAVLPTLSHGLAILQGTTGECAAVGAASGRPSSGCATVVSVNISETKGRQKTPIPVVTLIADHGIAGDAHAATERQVSLLAAESIDKLREKLPDLAPGAFAENIVTEGIVLHTLPVGTRFKIGSARCEVTQIGKDCHDHGCAIKRAVGDCVMPREGIFARVLEGGEVRSGDEIRVCE